MNTQNIQAEKLALITWISELQDVSLLKEMKKFYAKSQQISDEKEQLKNEIREAVEELKLVREGKLKGIPARELLDEL